MLHPYKEYYLNKLKLKKMKASLKLNKLVVVVILLIASFCLQGNASYAQGLFGKIKKAQEDIKKTKADATKKVDEVKNVTGTGNDVSSGSNNSSGSTDNSSGTRTGGSDSKNISYDNPTSLNDYKSVIPAAEQDFVKKITVSNQTGYKIYLTLKIYDGDQDISMGSRITCEVGKNVVVDLVASAKRNYTVYNPSGGDAIEKTVNDKGKYVYQIQADLENDFGVNGGLIGSGADGFSTIAFLTSYNGDGFKEIGNIVKVALLPIGIEALAKKERQKQAKADANNPNKLGTLTIVNKEGGSGKIYCVLIIPFSDGGYYDQEKNKKFEFMLGANMGDKYVIKDLRLFKGYKLFCMPEADKSKYPNRVENYIPYSLSENPNNTNNFRMQDGLIANVGEGGRGKD
jgi:hypothetical protein